MKQKNEPPEILKSYVKGLLIMAAVVLVLALIGSVIWWDEITALM